MAAAKPPRSAKPLQSVGIAVAIVDELAGGGELGPSQLARRLGLARSTTHRTCGVLADAGLLQRVDGGRYRLGLRLVELGRLAVRQSVVGDNALDLLARLRAGCGETVQIGVADGAEVVYVERVEGNRALRVPADGHSRSPVHRSSAGKILAAFVSGVFEARVAAGLAPSTGYTIVVPELFRAEIDRVRTQSWARSIDETEIGMSSLAVPVKAGGDDGPVVAALSMVGPSPRIVGASETRNLELLRRTASELGSAIHDREYHLPDLQARIR